MRALVTSISILIFSIVIQSCSSTDIKVIKVKNGVEINTPEINVIVQFYSNNIVRILKWTSDGKREKLSLMVIQDEIPELEIGIEDTKNEVLLNSESLWMKIKKASGKIEFYDKNRLPILKENNSHFVPCNYLVDSAFSITQEFDLSEDEAIYGLGQHQHGYMNLRNKEVILVQSNTDAVNPMLISTHGYGILWDNYSKTIYSDNGKVTTLWSDLGDNIDYYFISGENMDRVISGYRHLTGKAPMYGKWAYGYWQSKEHYDNQDELMSVALKYRELKIPIDNIIQDWDYWNGPKNWSGMFFDKQLFPQPKQMVDRLHSMNYHMMISIWPALGPNTEIYADMLQHGFLYHPVGWAGFKYYDAYNPAANKLYWQYLKKGLYSKGIDAWWIDSTEPDVINALSKDATEYELKKMGSNFLGSNARYLNSFSLVMTDALYKNLRDESENRRAYILTRSTFAGQQRNAATTWSGDIGASWDIFKKQIAAGLNHSMSGIPYWTFDIGAFVIGSYGGIFPNGGKSPSYQELYCRMFQFGAFSPVFRSHGSETPREIYEFGDFTEPMVTFDNLRYRLMPYIYSLAAEVTQNDYTIMRGLAMDFTDDRNTYSIDDQFMFGSSIMVNPVTEFMYHRPPGTSVLIPSKNFKTISGEEGLNASYFKDYEFTNLSLERIDPDIDILWYSGRPDYVTDSMYSIRWTGKLIPDQTGKHQFHLKSFDTKRIFLDGKELPFIYTSVEYYTDTVELEAGKEYDLVMEIENNQTGAARAMLYWRTPDMLEANPDPVDKGKTRPVYLPRGSSWINFWNGKSYSGGQTIIADAPIEVIPLFVKTGSIVPMGPYLQYSTEKPADPIELRIYTGADGSFTLYEDENDNYNYEQGLYTTIEFKWDDANKMLSIGERKGVFPGMLNKRTFNIVMVRQDHGTGVEITEDPDLNIFYTGKGMTVQL